MLAIVAVSYIDIRSNCTLQDRNCESRIRPHLVKKDNYYA